MAAGYTPDPYSQFSTDRFRNPTTPMNQRAGLPPVSPQAKGMVYMGTTGSKLTPHDNFISTANAYNAFYSLAPEARTYFNGVMDKYYPNGWQPNMVSKIWNKAVGAAAYALEIGGQRISPLEALDSVAAVETGGGSGGGGGGGGAYTGPVTSRQTSTAFNITDPSTARGLINKSLSAYLGREASSTEQDAFLQALNAQEKKNPSKTTQVSTTTPGVGTSDTVSRSMSKGGFNPTQFAQEYAQGQEGSAEFQAATGLLDTFIGSLKARV